MKKLKIKIFDRKNPEKSRKKFVEVASECEYLNKVWGLKSDRAEKLERASAKKEEVLASNDKEKVVKLSVGMRHGKYKTFYACVRKLSLEINRKNSIFFNKKGERVWVPVKSIHGLKKKDIIRLSRNKDEKQYMISFLDRRIKKRKNEMITDVRLSDGAEELIKDIMLED